jgi:hypothetical protein
MKARRSKGTLIEVSGTAMILVKPRSTQGKGELIDTVFGRPLQYKDCAVANQVSFQFPRDPSFPLLHTPLIRVPRLDCPAEVSVDFPFLLFARASEASAHREWKHQVQRMPKIVSKNCKLSTAMESYLVLCLTSMIAW